ncbi:MAG: hypothetical protein H6924_02145 [Alphaproteobacteria bacterium]|nr:hypothetical protein [Alphaproteobacteria bacterium]
MVRDFVIIGGLLAVAVLPAQAQEDGIAPEALNSLSRVHVAAITAKPVFDIHGERIGSISGVTPTGDGMVWSVTIRLENGRQVNGQPANGAPTQSILASQASFDGERVVADAPRS